MYYGFTIINYISFFCKNFRYSYRWNTNLYLFRKPLIKSTPNKTEPEKDEMNQIMKKLIKLNNGNNIIGISRMKGYLKSNMKLSRREVEKTVNTIKSQCELIEKKGTEEFYKLKG